MNKLSFSHNITYTQGWINLSKELTCIYWGLLQAPKLPHRTLAHSLSPTTRFLGSAQNPYQSPYFKLSSRPQHWTVLVKPCPKTCNQNPAEITKLQMHFPNPLLARIIQSLCPNTISWNSTMIPTIQNIHFQHHNHTSRSFSFLLHNSTKHTCNSSYPSSIPNFNSSQESSSFLKTTHT